MYRYSIHIMIHVHVHVHVGLNTACTLYMYNVHYNSSRINLRIASGVSLSAHTNNDMYSTIAAISSTIIYCTIVCTLQLVHGATSLVGMFMTPQGQVHLVLLYKIT